MTFPFAVVLVRPARPANVGAVARAMKNFGFSDLRLVGARTGLPGDSGHGEARALAWNAADVLEGATAFDRLEQAVSDLGLVAATTGRLEPGFSVATPRELADEVGALATGVTSGCVLGPEDHGLSNEELDLCRVRVRIPTRSEQPSLNLAQAACVLCYEISLAVGSPAVDGADADAPEPASEGDMERLSRRARELLLRAGYLNPQAPQHVLGELRRLVARSRPTHREALLLQGLVAQLDWAWVAKPGLEATGDALPAEED